MQEFITNSLGYPLRISALAVDSNNSNTVVAGTYAYGIGGAAAPITTSGIYLSANQGMTWTHCLITAPGMPTTSTQWISDLVLDNSTNPTTIYAAIGQSNLSGYDNPNPANGIYTSTMSASPPTSPCPAPTNWRRILKTGDVFGGQTHPDFGRIKLARYNHGILYTIIGSVDGGGASILGVAQTTDGGHSWSNQYDPSHFRGCSHDSPLNPPFSQPRLNLYVKVDPFFSNIVYAGIGDLYRSTDGGANFADQNCLYSGQNAIHQDQHALAFRTGLFVSNIIFGNDGGLWSLDWTSPATLTNLNDTFSTLQMYAGDLTPNFAADPNAQALGGMQDNGTAVYTGQYHSQPIPMGADQREWTGR